MMTSSQISQNASAWSRVKSYEYICSQALLSYPCSKSAVLSLKRKGYMNIPSYALRFAKYTKTTRNFRIHGSAGPALPPSGPPPNTTSWIVAVVVALVIPLINFKWGTLAKKIESALQSTEDVAEAVEKVAEEVEKVAEDIADDLPTGGKLREVVDFIEHFAETTAKEAGVIDEIIDKVQEEEEKVNPEKEDEEMVKQSGDDQIKRPEEKSSDNTPQEDNPINDV